MFEGIDPKVLGAVRDLAREMRYRHLISAVGRRVQIDGVDSIDRALRVALPEIPTDSKLSNETPNMRLTLAKYGLLDISYEVASIDAPPIGYPVLRELGLLARDEAEASENVTSVNQEIIAWVDECRAGPPLLRYFLQGPRPSDIVLHDMERRGFDGGQLAEYLPQQLTVIDACETNGAFLWLLKHFYL